MSVFSLLKDTLVHPRGGRTRGGHTLDAHYTPPGCIVVHPGGGQGLNRAEYLELLQFLRRMYTYIVMQKNNVSLYIALAIPVVMVAVLALAIYGPKAVASPPQYDFVYSRGDSRYYPYSFEYAVREGRVEQEPVPTPPDAKLAAPREPRLYLYDVSEERERELSLTEVQALRLDTASTSADGFTLERGGRGGGVFPFFFDSGDYNSLYLSKGSYNVKLNIGQGDFRYDGQDLRFLGWIIS